MSKHAQVQHRFLELPAVLRRGFALFPIIMAGFILTSELYVRLAPPISETPLQTQEIAP